MAEGNSSEDQQHPSEEIRLIRSVLGGILADDSMTLPTEGNKKCLELARAMVRCYGSATPSKTALEFACWIISTLNGVIVKAQKRGKPNELNQERLWRRFNILTNSDNFTKKWQDFLKASQLDDHPVFYQHFTDELSDNLVQKKLRAVLEKEGTSRLMPEDDGSDNTNLSFEEENAVRYIGGFVVKKLKENPEFRQLSTEMICSDESDENSPSATWTNAIDRGGLVKIAPEAYQIFLAIECCVRRHLNVKNASQMDDSFKRHMTHMLISDDDVLFYWCMAGFESSDNERCLQFIVDKWITIRDFSFMSSMMEIYKQENNKGTGKSKSLRTKLYCDK